MYPHRLLIFAILITLVASQAVSEPRDGGAGMPDRAELEAALDECASSATLDSNGRPDHSAMESCMSAKGFSRPSGPPGHGSHGPGGDNPPPERPEE